MFAVGCAALSAVSLAGCVSDNPRGVADVDPAGWALGEEVRVTIDNSDTVSLRRLSVFMLHGAEALDGRAVELAITTLTPDSLTITESMMFYPTTGEKAGAGASQLMESVQTYRSDVVLRRQGQYIFDISHRRAQSVKGVRAVGVEITTNGKE